MAGSMILAYCTSRGIPCIGLSRPEFDALGNWKQALQAVLQPDSIVINCIGLIPQKITVCSYTQDQFTRINSQFPHELASFCKNLRIPMIHLSTNCVFESGPSDEQKEPDATDMYGISKAQGEPLDALVIRTSIIGPEPYGPYVSLLEWFLHQDTPVKGYTNHTWNGITTLELAKCIEHLVQGPLEYKRLHLYSPACLSKYEVLQTIANVYKKDLHIEPMSTKIEANTTLASMYPSIVSTTIEDQIQEVYTFSHTYVPLK